MASARVTRQPIRIPVLLDALREVYGAPEPPRLTDPLALVLWENVAYLVDDRRRAEAYRALAERVGSRPKQILAAPPEVLAAIARIGAMAESRAEKLRAVAEVALREFGGDLGGLGGMPLPVARKALQRFPGIGAPGADKILLFSRCHPVFALESNGLRVLFRLGYGVEAGGYAATYRSVLESIRDQLPADYDRLIEAHQLLRQHGQELCRRSQPRCEACPVAAGCAYAGRTKRTR
jgi:endonuclease III